MLSRSRHSLSGNPAWTAWSAVTMVGCLHHWLTSGPIAQTHTNNHYGCYSLTETPDVRLSLFWRAGGLQQSLFSAPY
ncbi:hypothetical protein N656DRAFT_163670 [Canariomyces notabilis]|uniref:Uncharacterized protein n=1 Tax=Canariomyces notabilis TaxID=2074819 RepID=A0AAN6TBU6_9PEZI|nr:hypothetical protein N656DRAFT_163670 [Canariomyces arenarius]